MDPIPNSAAEDIKWVKFWETPGSLSAELIAGRLRSEGIPAWVWQQGAGAALGLTYGPMGRGHVMVPEEDLEAARLIMAEDLAAEEEGREAWSAEDKAAPQADGWFSKTVLALLALAVSPLGVAAAYVVAKLLGGEDKEAPACPDCGLVVDLTDREKDQGWYVCPDCGRTVLVRE